MEQRSSRDFGDKESVHAEHLSLSQSGIPLRLIPLREKPK